MIDRTRLATTRRHRLLIQCASAAIVSLMTSSARADLTIAWDCFLPSTGLDCALIEASLLGKIPFLRSVPSRSEADVAVSLTSTPAED
ncbi:MAG: hypothetical protein ACHREM_23940, partial [Polyangiales bacterium]